VSTSKALELPEEIENLYLTLWQAVVWLHRVWNQYCHLFRTSPEELDLLNQAAAGFFRVCHDALLDDVVLSLCRLTDPPANRHQTNLSLQRIADEVRAWGNTALTAAVDRHAAEAKARCEVLRKHRDKRIAHADFQVAVYKSPLGNITEKMIEEALESVRNFTNAIGEHVQGAPTDFQTPGALLGEGDDLIYRLKEAKAYRMHQMEGTVNPITDGIRRV
jgi:hypothetical protein